MAIDPLDSLKAPPALRSALATLRTHLSDQAGDNLMALVLFGGLARGRYTPGRSDVNLLVVLGRAGMPELERLAPPLHSAWRANRVEPLLLAAAEIPDTARCFPTKFHDILAHHLRFHGADPFGTLSLDRIGLALRTEQELTNIALRLRRRCLPLLGHGDELALLLARTARPLAIALRTLLVLADESLPEADRTSEIFSRSAVRFGLDANALARLAELRQRPDDDVDAQSLLQRVLTLLPMAAAVAAGFQEVRR